MLLLRDRRVSFAPLLLAGEADSVAGSASSRTGGAMHRSKGSVSAMAARFEKN